MEKIYTFKKMINDDEVVVNVSSSEIEELTTRVQESLEYWKSSDRLLKMDVLGLIEVEARKKARAEMDKQGLSVLYIYFTPLKAFYTDLIKDELLRRLV